MPAKIVIAALLGSAIGAEAQATPSECNAGNKLKKKLAGLTCGYSSSDSASCDTDCCEADTTTCGGLAVACGANTYNHVTGNSATAKAALKAWAATAATEATKTTTCCTPKAVCGSTAYTCPAGQKRKPVGNAGYAAWLVQKCNTDAESCAKTCCQNDALTCGGYVAANGATACTNVKLKQGTDDAWKKITLATSNAAGFQAACCQTPPTCKSHLVTCPAGQTKDNTKTCTNLDPSQCATDCCKRTNTEYCGGRASIACPASTYRSAALANVTAPKTHTATQLIDTCCAPKATCKLANCPAGYKRKPNTDALFCSGDAASCAVVTPTSTCCMKDTKKCGGLAGFACATGFYDEAANSWANIKGADADATAKLQKAAGDAWKNRAATEATKNKDCCTAKATCTAAVTGSTAPAPVAATTTPVAPALKYSQHQAAVKISATSNLTWLTVGAVSGMGLLMLVQHVRGTPRTPTIVGLIEDSEVE